MWIALVVQVVHGVTSIQPRKKMSDGRIKCNRSLGILGYSLKGLEV